MSSNVLLLRGPQGVGKTTVAKRLASDHGFMHLAKDDIYNQVMPEIGDHHAASRVAYASIKSIIHANRSTGVDIVIDAPVRQLSDVRQWEREVTEWNFFFSSVLLYCSDVTTWDARLNSRSESPEPNHQITSLAELYANGSQEVDTYPGELALDTSVLSAAQIALRCAEHSLEI